MKKRKNKDMIFKQPTFNVRLWNNDFEIEVSSSEERLFILIVITGLLVVGKEYYDLLKSFGIRFSDEALWSFIENKFENEK